MLQGDLQNENNQERNEPELNQPEDNRWCHFDYGSLMSLMLLSGVASLYGGVRFRSYAREEGAGEVPAFIYAMLLAGAFMYMCALILSKFHREEERRWVNRVAEPGRRMLAQMIIAEPPEQVQAAPIQRNATQDAVVIQHEEEVNEVRLSMNMDAILENRDAAEAAALSITPAMQSNNGLGAEEMRAIDMRPDFKEGENQGVVPQTEFCPQRRLPLREASLAFTDV